MSESHTSKLDIKPVTPSVGITHVEDIAQYVLCKPKILPMKSVTLEKLEQMQKEALMEAKAQRKADLEAEASSAF